MLDSSSLGCYSLRDMKKAQQIVIQARREIGQAYWDFSVLVTGPKDLHKKVIKARKSLQEALRILEALPEGPEL